MASFETAPEHDARPFDAVDRWGEVFTDRAAFAAALAPHLGGTFTRDPESPEGATYGVVRIELTTLGLRIVIHAKHGANSRGRLSLAICAAGPLAYDNGVKFPSSITIDSGRPLETLARDVSRRLIEPSAGPLAALRQRAAEKAAAEQSAESTLASLQKRFPGARFSLASDRVQVDVSGPSGLYIHARMRDGRLYIERAGSFEPEHSSRILAAIFGDRES